MRRSICLLLALCCLLLCACGRKKAEEPGPEPTPLPVETPAQLPEPEPTPQNVIPRGSYHTVEITSENWTQFFTLREIPLYILNRKNAEEPEGESVVAAIYQNYCVTLRDELLPYLDPEGDYSVRFRFSFDLYINQLNVDTRAHSYGHTNDLLFACTTSKEAVFDKHALSSAAYGGESGDYAGYGNAFFKAWATLDVDHKVWDGFYIDLNQITLESVSGSLSLA